MKWPPRAQRHDIDVSTAWGKPEFTGWVDEGLSWKQTCYIGDWSWLDEFNVKGPDAIRFFSDFAVNSFAKFDIGQAKHAIFCSKVGKVIGEGVLTRLGADELEFNAAGPVSTWLKFNLEKGAYNAKGELRVTKTKFQVSGPTALYALEKLTGEKLRDIGFMRMRKAKINGHEVGFLRQGMAGEVGFELHGDKAHAREIYDAVLDAGREFGIRRLGTRTALINHLEAGFPTINFEYLPAVGGEAERDYFEAYDIKVTDTTSEAWRRNFERSSKVRGSFEGASASAWYRSPVELGWVRNIKFDHDFWGREALEAEVKNPKRTMVALVWNAQDVIDVYASLFDEAGDVYEFMDMPRSLLVCNFASKVVDGDKLIGVATSRGYSVSFRKMLSHCVIDIAYSKPGTEVTVIWGEPGMPQKRIRGTVHSYPYKQNYNRSTDLKKMPVELPST